MRMDFLFIYFILFFFSTGFYRLSFFFSPASKKMSRQIAFIKTKKINFFWHRGGGSWSGWLVLGRFVFKNIRF